MNSDGSTGGSIRLFATGFASEGRRSRKIGLCVVLKAAELQNTVKV